jgi:hypothetical protein
MARNPALDKVLSRMERVDAAAAGETEEELQAARDAAKEGDTGSDETPPETPPAEAPKPETPAPETPPAGTETPPETPEAAKPDEAATREENARRAAQRRDRETREAKAELARQRAENERLQRELQEIRSRPAAPASDGAPGTTPPVDQEPPKPGAEPDPEQYPVEHDRWEARLARHEAWQARQQTRQLQEQINSWSQGAQRQTEEQRVISQFDGLMATHERAYQEDNAEYDPAVKFLEQRLGNRMRFDGVPEHEIPVRIQMEKRAFLVRHTAAGRNNGEPSPADYALGKLYDLAVMEGFQPGTAATNGKTTTQRTPAARIADGEKRQAAARSASTMSATPVEPKSDEDMTADRWMGMNSKQRTAWKKAHPDFNATDLLDDGGDDLGNPILENMRALRR